VHSLASKSRIIFNIGGNEEFVTKERVYYLRYLNPSSIVITASSDA
jgi:hypothetical protein